MSDRQLRELERAMARSGDPADEARLLAHRVRAGLLHPAWLEAAARLGHAPARRVLGRFVPILDERGLVEALPLLGRRAAVVGLLAQAREGLAAWDEVRSGDDRPRRALEALDAWARTPATQLPHEASAVAEEALRQVRITPADLAAWSIPQPVRDGAQRVVGAARTAVASDHAWPGEAARALRDFPDEVRGVREALVPWVLGPPPGTEPPAWPPPVGGSVDVATVREAERAFAEALIEKATRTRATALRRRLREKRLEKPLVEVAADLGDPAAWLVARARVAGAKRPDPSPVDAADEVVRRLIDLLDRRAAPTRKRVAQRRHWTDDGGRDRSAVGWRMEPGAARWPAWSGRFLTRAALALAERIAASATGERRDPRVAAALEALRARYRNPGDPAADARASSGWRRRLAAQLRTADRREATAAGALAAACALAAADEPAAPDALRALVDAAEAAGVGPAEQWELLRVPLIAWALGEDVLGSDARPYVASERYAEGERMAHRRFGEGRVVRVLGDKVEVDFEGGPRTLVHGRV